MFGQIKYGICEWAFPIQGPYGCKVAKELALDGIQLEMGPYERGFPLSKKSIQQAYLEMAKEHGISFPGIDITDLDHYNMVASRNSSEQQIAITAIKKAIDTACSMNIPAVLIPSFGKSMIESKEDFENAVSVLKYACKYAEDKKVTIATENVLSVEEIFMLFDKVDHSNLRLFFDSQNHYLHKGYNMAELLKKVFPLICGVHLKDGKNGFLSASLLGEGDSGFFDTLKTLSDLNYTGWLILENYYDREPLSSESKDPLDLVKKDIEILKSTVNSY